MEDAVEPLLFTVDERYRIRDIESILKVLGSIQSDPPRTEELLVVDSFDWRVYRHGGFVTQVRHGSRVRTVWRDRESGAVMNVLVGPTPRFAHEFPAGPLREKLSAALDMRALLPVVRIRSRVYELRLLNSEGKTVVRVFLELHKAIAEAGKEMPLGKVLRIAPVRGYGKACKKVRSRLLKMGAGTPVHDLLIEQALHVVGRHPGENDHASVRLVADIPVSLAMAVILRDLFRVMEANEEGVLAGTDTEFLHDYRITVRSVRSLLGQLRRVFPVSMAHLRSEFAWLGAVTTPVRDLDVFLLHFVDPSGFFPRHGEHLLPLQTFLIREQENARNSLQHELKSARYQRLKRELRHFLNRPESEEWPDQAADRVLEMASQQIWRGYRRIIRQGGAITAGSPAEARHDLRKTCKKLRYLLGFFHSLYPAAEMSILMKAMKQLQNNLGEYQDLFFQSQSLIVFREKMAASGELTDQVDLALEAVLARHARREIVVRKAFDSRFQKFSDSANQKRFRRLFSQPVKRGKA